MARQAGTEPETLAAQLIALLGDIHGDSNILAIRAKQAHDAGCVALIQVGDFGVYPRLLDDLIAVAKDSPIPIYFIDGNHEHYPMIDAWPSSGSYALVPGKLTYVRRGEVLRIAGHRVGFLGGAGSIDYNYRTRGRDWFPDGEQVTDAQVDALLAEGPVDILVTHTPPRSFIDKHFDVTPQRARQARAMFGAAPDWTDPSADKVQRAWNSLGNPPLVCGHMHAAIADGKIRLLNIGEAMVWP